jgi:hypothetical protein
MPVPSIGDSCFVLRPQLQRTMDIKDARKREKSGHTRNCLSLMPAPLDRRALFYFKTLTRQNSGVSRTLASGRKHTRAKPFRFLSRHSTISFWRKAGSYFPRPRLRSQTTMSMTVLKLRVAAHHRAVWRVCPGSFRRVPGFHWREERGEPGFHWREERGEPAAMREDQQVGPPGADESAWRR